MAWALLMHRTGPSQWASPATSEDQEQWGSNRESPVKLSRKFLPWLGASAIAAVLAVPSANAQNASDAKLTIGAIVDMSGV